MFCEYGPIANYSVKNEAPGKGNVFGGSKYFQYLMVVVVSRGPAPGRAVTVDVWGISGLLQHLRHLFGQTQEIPENGFSKSEINFNLNRLMSTRLVRVRHRKP